MRLSTKARYGIRALCHVAHRGYASAQAIAEQQVIPSRYLEEIIRELRKAGLVVGKRGPHGGYRLARPAGEIAVADVLRALAAHPEGGPTGHSRDEVARIVEDAVDRRLQEALGALSLDELLAEARDRCRRRAADYVI
jgi:Rrf2 family protein